MSTEKKVLYNVEIEGQDKVLSSMAALRKENSEITREQKTYQRALKDGVPMSEKTRIESERNGAVLKENKKKINELSKELKSKNGVVKGTRQELTHLRRAMQESAAAGDTSSASYVQMRDRAAEVQDQVDRVSAEIKLFADDALVINTVVDATQGLAAGFQLVQSTQALLGVESEALVETLVKLQAAQGVVNSLQSISNMLQKESRLVILGKIAAQKIATAAQWAWNAAMTANPIGLIVAAIAALGAGIYALVEHFDTVIKIIKQAWDALAFWKSSSDEASESTEELSDETEDLGDKIERLDKLYKDLNKKHNQRLTQMQREIELAKAKGVEMDKIRDMEREALEEEIRMTEKSYYLLMEEQANLFTNLDDMSRRDRKRATERLEELDDLIKKEGELLSDLNHQNTLFFIEDNKRREENREQRREERREEEAEREKQHNERLKRQEELLHRERLASLELKHLKEQSLESEIAVLEEKHRQSINVDKMTKTEIELAEAEHLNKIDNIRKDHFEAKFSENLNIRKQQLQTWFEQEKISRLEYEGWLEELEAELKEKEEEEKQLKEEEKQLEEEQRIEERERLQEEYQMFLDEQVDQEILQFERRREELDKFLNAGKIDYNEYLNYMKKINEEEANHYIQTQMRKMQETASYTMQVLDTVSQHQNMQMQKELNAAGDNEKKKAQIKAEYAEKQKQIDLIQAIIGTALAVTNALQTQPFMPMGPLMAVLAAAQGAVQISTIKNASIPKAEKGAIIKGSSHTTGGIKFTSDHGHQFEMEGDEYFAIINKRDSKRAAMLDSINRKHGDPLFSNSPMNYFARGGAKIAQPREDTGEFTVNEAVNQTIEDVMSIPVVVAERDITTTQRRVEVMEDSGDL